MQRKNNGCITYKCIEVLHSTDYNQADDPENGNPSDHSTVLYSPAHACTPDTAINVYSTKLSRPLPQSDKIAFGQWLMKQDWTELNENSSPSQVVAQFNSTLNENLHKYLPQKSVRISSKDKPYITSDIKRWDRLKKR